MFKFILRWFSKETIWREIFDREGFTLADDIEAKNVWGEVFHRNPELRNYLRRREIALLKASTLKEKSADFILGQVAENRLFQAFDTGKVAATKVVKTEVKKVISQENFLSRWIKNASEPVNESSNNVEKAEVSTGK